MTASSWDSWQCKKQIQHTMITCAIQLACSCQERIKQITALHDMIRLHTRLQSINWIPGQSLLNNKFWNSHIFSTHLRDHHTPKFHTREVINILCVAYSCTSFIITTNGAGSRRSCIHSTVCGALLFWLNQLAAFETGQYCVRLIDWKFQLLLLQPTTSNGGFFKQYISMCKFFYWAISMVKISVDGMLNSMK